MTAEKEGKPDRKTIDSASCHKQHTQREREDRQSNKQGQEAGRVHTHSFWHCKPQRQKNRWLEEATALEDPAL